MKWTWTGKPFVWYWLKNWGWEEFVPRWCLGISHSNSGMRDWAQFLTCKCITVMLQPPYSTRTLLLLFISKSKIGSEMTLFGVNRRHPEGCNAGLKRHPTSCVPGMLQPMAAPLGKVCASTRNVLWSCPHCSWWINKIKLFFGTSFITLLSDLIDGKTVWNRLFSRWVKDMNWLYMAQDRDRWRVLANTVINLRVPRNAGNFMSSWVPVSFSRRTAPWR